MVYGATESKAKDYLAIYRNKILRDIETRKEKDQHMLERMKKMEEDIKNKQSNDK